MTLQHLIPVLSFLQVQMTQNLDGLSDPTHHLSIAIPLYFLWLRPWFTSYCNTANNCTMIQRYNLVFKGTTCEFPLWHCMELFLSLRCSRICNGLQGRVLQGMQYFANVIQPRAATSNIQIPDSLSEFLMFKTLVILLHIVSRELL